MIIINKTLLVIIIASLLPISMNGQRFGLSYEELVHQIDTKIQNVILQRKSNHNEQDKINDFVREVGKWFDRYSGVQTKIKNTKIQYEDYNSFNKKQKLQQALQQLEQERIAVSNLNGGATIQGVTYHSIEELQNAMTTKGKELITLINEDEKLKADLRTLDAERDKYVAEIELNNDEDYKKNLEEKWDYLRLKYTLYEDDFRRDYESVNDVNMWCAKAKDKSSIKCLDRKLYIALITSHYIQQLTDTPGKKYDQKELAEMIKLARDQSNAAKQEALKVQGERRKEIKSIEKQLYLLNKQISEKKILNVNPSGCWVIVIGSGRRPVITIRENAYGEFDAIITDPGPLDYKKGTKLFTMARVNATTFDGTEYSFSDSHEETRIPVRLIISNDGSSMEYRTSDDLLTLLPCM